MIMAPLGLPDTGSDEALVAALVASEEVWGPLSLCPNIPVFSSEHVAQKTTRVRNASRLERDTFSLQCFEAARLIDLWEL